MELATRKEVPVELTWDLSALYGDEEAFQADVEKVKALTAQMEEAYKGKLDTPENILACLDLYREMSQLLNLAYSFRDLAASVDFGDARLQEENERMAQLASQVSSRLSFIDSEITAQPEETLNAAIAQGGPNCGYLKELLRWKPHQLEPQTEKVLATLSPTLNTPYQVYNMAKLADMRFPSFQAGGQENPLGYSLFEDKYEYDPNTEVRREAFKNFSAKLREYENVTAAAYQSQVQKEKTLATLRGFDSVYDYLLFQQNRNNFEFD